MQREPLPYQNRHGAISGSSQFEGAILVYTRNAQFSYTRNAQFSLYQDHRNAQFWYTSNVQFLHSRTDNWCNSHYSIIIGCTFVRHNSGTYQSKSKKYCHLHALATVKSNFMPRLRRRFTKSLCYGAIVACRPKS